MTFFLTQQNCYDTSNSSSFIGMNHCTFYMNYCDIVYISLPHMLPHAAIIHDFYGFVLELTSWLLRLAMLCIIINCLQCMHAHPTHDDFLL